MGRIIFKGTWNKKKDWEPLRRTIENLTKLPIKPAFKTFTAVVNCVITHSCVICQRDIFIKFAHIRWQVSDLWSRVTLLRYPWWKVLYVFRNAREWKNSGFIIEKKIALVTNRCFLGTFADTEICRFSLHIQRRNFDPSWVAFPDKNKSLGLSPGKHVGNPSRTWHANDSGRCRANASDSAQVLQGRGPFRVNIQFAICFPPNCPQTVLKTNPGNRCCITIIVIRLIAHVRCAIST